MFLLFESIVQIVLIVQPIVIAWIVEVDEVVDLRGDTCCGSSGLDKPASFMWATFGLLFFYVE
jgi:hypothetical protein